MQIETLISNETGVKVATMVGHLSVKREHPVISNNDVKGDVIVYQTSASPRSRDMKKSRSKSD